MTVELISINDAIEILTPQPSVTTITPPDTGVPLAVVTPPVPIELFEDPDDPVGLVVPVAGAPGAPGQDGAPGQSADDIPDMGLIFENGLI